MDITDIAIHAAQPRVYAPVILDKAQEVTDHIITGGIKALWNFTPFRIRVPEDIVVQNTSMYAHLAVMFNRLNSINH